jgi:hypothetical protein
VVSQYAVAKKKRPDLKSLGTIVQITCRGMAGEAWRPVLEKTWGLNAEGSARRAHHHRNLTARATSFALQRGRRENNLADGPEEQSP